MAFAGGDGSVNNPYLVSTAEHLNDVRNFLSSSFLQVSDIDISGYSNWSPIGDFLGIYDGNGYKISNLKIYNNTESGIGLFKRLVGGSLKNIGLENVFIESYSSRYIGNEVGSLVGSIDWGRVEKCYSTGVIIAHGGYYIGGLIGEAIVRGGNIQIYDCWSSVEMRAEHFDYLEMFPDGGLGWNGNNTEAMGGLIGLVQGYESIDSLYNAQKNPPPNETERENSVFIRRCHSSGSVMSYNPDKKLDSFKASFGGLIGQLWGGLAKSCYSTGDVRGTTEIGGCFGQIGGCFIIDCYSKGNVVYDEDYGPADADWVTCGSFVGLVWEYVRIENCYSSGSIPSGDIASYNGVKAFCGVYAHALDKAYLVSCYYNSTVVGDSDPSAIPKTSVELKKVSTFDGWDFKGVWGIDSSVNEGYPYLLGKFAGGDGSVESPYLVSTWNQLYDVRDNLSANYLQINSISFPTNVSWAPIGSAENPFEGYFNGGNYYINSLEFDYVGMGTLKNIGLFGVAKNSSFINMRVIPMYSINNNFRDFKGDLPTYDSFGFIVGHMDGGLVSNCYVDCISVYSYVSICVGSLIGIASCESGNLLIDGCRIISSYVSNGPNRWYDGSLIGLVNGVSLDGEKNVKIQRCNSYTDSVHGDALGVEIPDTALGGFIGKMVGGSVEECSMECAIRGVGNVGGFIGHSIGTVIRDCYCIGSVDNNNGNINPLSDKSWGGFIGRGVGITVENCGFRGKLNTINQVDFKGLTVRSFISVSMDSTIINCYYSSDENVFDDLFATPLNSEQIKAKASYYGWNFSQKWNIDSSINDGYPYLRCEFWNTFSGGAGLKGDPYLISSVEQLKEIDFYRMSYFLQVNDIYLTGLVWMPLGVVPNHYPINYDGGNFSICDMYSNTVSYGVSGLFHEIKGTVKNVNILNFLIDGGEFESASDSGALAWRIIGGSVDNCHVKGEIVSYVGDLREAGGLASICSIGESGGPDTVVSNCTADVKISSFGGHNRLIGLLFGSVHSGSEYEKPEDVGAMVRIYRCHVSGSLTLYSDDVTQMSGGLVGGCDGGIISECSVSAELKASNIMTMAGFIGHLHYNPIIRDCYFIGQIRNIPENIPMDALNNTHVGGFTLTSDYDVKIENCYAILYQTKDTYINYELETESEIGKLASFLSDRYNDSGSLVISCYYNSEISKLLDWYATPLSDAEMKIKESFLGWDFENVWGINPLINNGYPYLGSQLCVIETSRGGGSGYRKVLN